MNGPQRAAMRLSPEEARLVQQIQAWRGDLPSYAGQCLHVVTKESQLVRMVFNAPQALIHSKVEQQMAEHGLIRALILKGRKQGSCLAPGTRICMADLTYRPIEDVLPGDEVLALDENGRLGEMANGRSSTRKMRVASVEATVRLRAEVFEIVLSNGTTLKATGSHRWLCRQRGGKWVQWRAVKDMKVGDYLRAATYAPDDTPPSHEDGWVGGLLDGDGSACVTGSPRISFNQVAGRVLDRYRDYLHANGIGFYENVDKRTAIGTRYRKLKDTHVWQVRVDRFCDIAWLAGRTRPIKFNIRAFYEGRKLPTTCKGFEAYPRVLSIRSLGVGAVYDLQTSEKTFVAEGIVSHNSTYVGARFYAKTQLHKYRNAKVMAHVQDSTNALFSMVQTFNDNNPFRLRADTSNAKQFEFSNGSSYTVATAGGSGEAGRGDTPTLAHLSEAAFYKNAEKNFAGFANSVPLSPGTEIFVESTANGLGNEFHRRWMRAEGGVHDEQTGIQYLPIFIPWFLSPEYRLPIPYGFQLRPEPEGDGLPSEVEVAEMFGLDDAQMAWRRFQIDEALGSVEQFMQEYPSSPSEAFQTTGVDLFIKPVWVMRARKRTGIRPEGPKILGVDPAGGGTGADKFSISMRQGMVLLWQRGRVGVDPQDAIHWIAGVIEAEQPDRVNIDNGGGWGASLLSGIRAHYPLLADRCYPVDFGGTSQFKAVNPHRPGPRNRRAEMYMRMREWFMVVEGCSIPDEDELMSDLGAVTARMGGQSTDTLICSKAEIKKNLGRSPDCFVAGTMVQTPRGERPIESLREGDEVVAPFGTRRVVAVHITADQQTVARVLPNGRVLTGKPGHGVYVRGYGIKPLSELRCRCNVEMFSVWSILAWRILNLWFTKGRNTGFKHRAVTIRPADATTRRGFFTEGYGLTLSVRSPLACVSTTAIETGRTILWATWNSCWSAIIRGCTRLRACVTLTSDGACSPDSPRREKQQESGTGLQRVWRGTRRTVGGLGIPDSIGMSRVSSAGRFFKLGLAAMCGCVPVLVSNRTLFAAGERTTSNRASSVARSSVGTLFGSSGTATDPAPRQPTTGVVVYNLTLDAENMYYANGALVENCADSMALTFAFPDSSVSMSLTDEVAGGTSAFNRTAHHAQVDAYHTPHVGFDSGGDWMA